MGDCFSDSASGDEAAAICEEDVYNAVISQIEDESANPTLVEAIPTIGKTTAAAKFAAEMTESDRSIGITYLTHLTDNRKQFVEKVREFANGDGGVNPVQLPVLEEDCPTAEGEHGEGWKNRIISLRDQGISPSTLHKNTRFSLPCGDSECPYMDWWSQDDEEDIIIGHLSHAYAPTVIEDRIVIVDEDPEDAFQTRFTSDELHDLVRSFLIQMDDSPPNDLDQLKLIRQLSDPSEQNVSETAKEQRSSVYEYATDLDYFELGNQILNERQDHIQAANVVKAFLEEKVDRTKQDGSYRTELGNGVEHSRLDENTVTAYNPRTGQFAIRRTPDFHKAAALVGLDGTPTKAIWKGRLGVDELDHKQVLTDECRREYLEEVLGYKLFQTSKYIKPYSGATPERISFQKDRGLLHEVQRKSDGEVGLITTKKARTELLDREDGNRIHIEDDEDEPVNHYRNIKGSNEFEGDEIQVGVVIGSPHPGSNELRLVAGLNGDVYEANRVDIEEGDHQYTRREPTEESRPYLEHFREHSVAQAVLRFGRTDGATVFIHTSAIPAWMKPMAEELDGRLRPSGEQEVIQALQDLSEATTAEVTRQTNVTINTVRTHLHSLAAEGLVSKGGDQQRFIWKRCDEIREISPTFGIEIPDIPR